MNTTLASELTHGFSWDPSATATYTVWEAECDDCVFLGRGVVPSLEVQVYDIWLHNPGYDTWAGENGMDTWIFRYGNQEQEYSTLVETPDGSLGGNSGLTGLGELVRTFQMP